MGNICRSPTAEAVARAKAQQRGMGERIWIDSAGTHNYHPGSPPDTRSQRHAQARGYDLSALRARQVVDDDFARHDLILVMDWDNLSLTEDLCPAMHRGKVRRLATFARRHQAEVIPDPYYGGAAGFEEVLDLIEDACDGLLDHLQQRLASSKAP